MIIKKISIGNSKEAFIEKRFSDGFNIISSDDNNKGKTIVIQSILYTLGNEPIFPDSFNYKDYFHIIEIITDKNESLEICRKKNTFAVLYNENLNTFDSVTEFKYFLNKAIFKLPIISKDGSNKIVDPVLFLQLFFVGQDSKDTSNIFQHGYYNKNDFIEMLASFAGLEKYNHNETDIEGLKNKAKLLKAEKQEIIKQNEILTSIIPAAALGSISNNRINFDNKFRKIDNLKNKIISLTNSRNRALSRKIKNEITIKEIRSLNNTLQVGTLKCLDCNSQNIAYTSASNSNTFDISSTQIREQILNSIEEKIRMYEEEIQLISIEMEKYQSELKILLSEEEINIESLFLYKSELVNSSGADLRLSDIEKELEGIKKILESRHEKNEDSENKRNIFFNKIFEKMNTFSKIIDPKNKRVFNNLFSLKQAVYSGVESTEFYLAKLYAIQAETKHNYPIIVDYFRGGELSSSKEKLVIDTFSKISNQKIFTVTLKEQELNKYKKFKKIKNIDYASHVPFKLLNSNDLKNFLKNIEKFSIIIE